MLGRSKLRLAQGLLAVWLVQTVAATAAGAADPVALEAARALHRQGEFEAAAAAYRDVLAADGVDEPSQAIAANNLCVVLDALGNLESAESACRRALAFRERSGDRLRLARTLNNLGLVLQHLGRYAEAEECFTEALAINRELGETRAQAINLANLGAVATQAGRFQQALERQAEVVELVRANAGEPWAAEQQRIAELNRGVVLERLGAYREALDVYRGLLEAGADLREEQRASILVNSGVIYRNLGDPVQAIARFEEAAAVYGELEDRAGRAHAELNIGIARHLNLGDRVGAEDSFRRALSWVEASGDRGLRIDVLCHLGRLLVVSGRLEAARHRFEEALELARDSDSVEGEWVALAGLGETERARGDPAAALDRFEHAILLIEEGRSEMNRPEHRASFLADKRSVYERALDTLAMLDGDTSGEFAARALEVAQRAKSRDLLDALEARRALGAHRAGPMTSLGADELARRLGTDILVEYFVTETDLLMWWTEAGSIRLARLGDPVPILDAVGRVHEALSSGSEPAPEIVARLSETLLGPLGATAEASDASASAKSDAHFWIAPDRRLRYLPFEILTAPARRSDRAVRPGRRLIEHARVSYLPSAWALPERPMRETPPTFETGFMGFGGVDFTRRTERAYWLSSLALEPLPAARRELESVARSLDGPSRIFFGSDATEASFRAGAGRSVGVLHFATHTALTGRRGEESAILLTPEGVDDGLLVPAEIVDSATAAALVVLASCTTAPGAQTDGRALTTLTGSFLASGSEAVLATLWPVGDQATAVFMEQFYHQLSSGATPSEALRRTKLRFLEDERWQNPALWSGYVLIGSGSAVVKSRHPWWWLAALALALALGALGWRARVPER